MKKISEHHRKDVLKQLSSRSRNLSTSKSVRAGNGSQCQDIFQIYITHVLFNLYFANDKFYPASENRTGQNLESLWS